MPKMYGGSKGKEPINVEPTMRMEGDSTKFMNTGNAKAPLGKIEWGGEK